MNSGNIIAEKAVKFYDDSKYEYARYKSWEHCYSEFQRVHNSKEYSDDDVDFLSLHLSFYLASWGMYRGSSFLLETDYKVHTNAIKELLKQKYDVLWGINVADYSDDNIELLFKLVKNIKKKYLTIKSKIKGFENSDVVSDTLVSKILLGTLGCTPAYDRFFIEAVISTEVATGQFNEKSIKKLVEFYNDNYDLFEKTRKKMKYNNIVYPQMKLLDSGFWQYGYEEDLKKKYKKGK